MDERIYHWLLDYAAMLELSVVLKDGNCAHSEINAACRKNAKDVREYLSKWRIAPPDSADAGTK